MIEMKMRKLLYLVLGASCLLTACTEAEKPKSDLRAPAYPLVTIDPVVAKKKFRTKRCFLAFYD